ncbi:MAG: O-antigen ligase family protein [Acidobacteria bacterium]|nr:O-antigen ligase family protein [Acidobacteriota bacterium]
MTSRAGRPRRRVIARHWPLLVLAVIIAVLANGRFAGPLRLAYPMIALAIGAYLERRSTARYVSFVIWLWFLSPLVRRLADLHAGWQDPSVVLLAPYLVTALAVPPLLHGFLRDRRSALPPVAGVGIFALAALGVAVGIPTGMLGSPSTAALETMNWFLPLCFGWYIATRVDDVHRIEAAVATTFVNAATVAGLYGLYQFTRPPLWDINWMQRSGMTTIGSPEPFAVRVFSTMHSPGIVSAFLVIALVLWLARPRLTGVFGAGVAGITLLLSQVRSAWLGLIVAALFVFASLSAAQRVRMATLALIAVVLAGPLMFTPQMRELVATRVATMERLDDDESAVARWTGHRIALEFVAERPLGAGIGQTDAHMEQYISMRDSVIASTLVQFGLVGTVLYFVAVAGMLRLLWIYYRRAASIQGAALASAGLGLLATSWLSVVTAGPIGVCLWMVAGLAIADRETRRRAVAAPAQVRRPWRTWVIQRVPASTQVNWGVR